MKTLNPIKSCYVPPISKFGRAPQPAAIKFGDLTNKYPCLMKSMNIAGPIFTCLYGLKGIVFGARQISKETKYHSSEVKAHIHPKMQSIYNIVISFKKKMNETELCGGVLSATSGIGWLVSGILDLSSATRSSLLAPIQIVSGSLYIFSGILFLINSAKILHDVNRLISGKNGLELQVLKDLQRMMIINIISSVFCILATSLLFLGCPALICMSLQLVSGMLELVGISMNIFKSSLDDHIKKIIEYK